MSVRTPAPTRRSAGIYARVSSSEIQERQDPETQLLPLREEAKRQGWTVYDEYVDYESGAKTSRPNLDRLLADVRAGKVDLVACWKFDRISRSALHLLKLLDEFQERGVES